MIAHFFYTLLSYCSKGFVFTILQFFQKQMMVNIKQELPCDSVCKVNIRLFNQ